MAEETTYKALTWDEDVVRAFETGCDHGVLFVKNAAGTGYEKGVAWNGLISVTETPSGAEANPLYADNQKYLNLISAEEFGCTIECYTYPNEFGVCNGETNLVGTQGAAVPGLRITQQTRRPFALCFRTKMGDAGAPERGHKLHMIYGCTATPSEKTYETVNDSPDAITMSFEVNCIAEMSSNTNLKPIYHLEIDEYVLGTNVSTGKPEWTKNAKYDAVEAALIGSSTADATFQTPDQIITLMTAA